MSAHAERGQPEEEEVALALEDFAMNFRENRARFTRQLNPTANHGQVDLKLPPLVNSAVPQPQPFLIDPQRSWALVQIYFNRLEWYTKCLHAPSFCEEVSI